MPDAKTQYPEGKYRVKVPTLKIRGTPTHKQGEGNFTKTSLTNGKLFDVYRVVENLERTGEKWGVITSGDVSQTLYVCLYDLNTRFAEFVEPFGSQAPVTPPIVPDNDDDLLERVIRMEQYLAVKLGYKP